LLTNIPASQLDPGYSGSKLIRMGEPEAKVGGHQGNADNGPASAGQRSAVVAKAAAIQAAQSHPLSWKTVLKRGAGLAAAGLAIYLVLPSLTEVLASWPRLSTLTPVWLAVTLAAELASFTCNFGLQRLALRARSWFPVVTAGLAGNAVTGILPGGAAAGAAVQFEMLGTAGFDTDTVVGGLTAFSLVNVAALLALPVLTIPAMLGGAVASPGLVHTALVGAAGFLLVAIAGAVVLRTDRPLAAAGRAAERLRNRLTRGRRPALTGLDARLLAERDAIKSVLDRKWPQAVLLTTGRIGFDYGCLLAALRATGAHPRPSLVLLAYAAANVVALVPVTPGGLGLVEASLGSLLILAGVHASEAFLATLAYRLASYWLPLLAGPPAYLLFRQRYGPAGDRPAGPDHGRAPR
jgi:uncharacterized protein (TIRG00374 family)